MTKCGARCDVFAVLFRNGVVTVYSAVNYWSCSLSVLSFPRLVTDLFPFFFHFSLKNFVLIHTFFFISVFSPEHFDRLLKTFSWNYILFRTTYIFVCSANENLCMWLCKKANKNISRFINVVSSALGCDMYLLSFWIGCTLIFS